MAGGYGGAKSWAATCTVCGATYKYSNQSKRSVEPLTLRVVSFQERSRYRHGRLVDDRDGLIQTDVHELACLRRQAARGGDRALLTHSSLCGCLKLKGQPWLGPLWPRNGVSGCGTTICDIQSALQWH